MADQTIPGCNNTTNRTTIRLPHLNARETAARFIHFITSGFAVSHFGKFPNKNFNSILHLVLFLSHQVFYVFFIIPLAQAVEMRSDSGGKLLSGWKIHPLTDIATPVQAVELVGIGNTENFVLVCSHGLCHP